MIVYSPMASGLLTGGFSAERVAALPERRLPLARAALPGAAAIQATWPRPSAYARSASARCLAGRGRGGLGAA